MAVFWHPLLFVYVITAVPAETPVIKPVLSTVATAVLEEAHGLFVAAVPLPVNCVVAPKHTLNVPVIVGNGFTVTTVDPVVKLELLAHAFAPVTLTKL